MSNRSAILKLLNGHGAMSRKDIAMELGLTPATVTLICTQLTLMWEKGIAKEDVLGAGISLPGPVKRDTGVSLHACRIWNEAVPVGEYMEAYMEAYLDLPVAVENNVKAFAQGELIYGTGKEQENLLFIKWGPGGGSAIIIQNKLYDSHNSKTAEIGHYIVEPGGLPCRCGRRGCLETHVATHAIADRVRRACNQEDMPGPYRGKHHHPAGAG